MRQRKFAILLIVGFAALVSVAGATWRLARSGEVRRPPAGLLPLADPGAFPDEYRPTARAVADALAGGGERSEEFFAQVEGSWAGAAGVVAFHLWHRSAWEPGNRTAVGNPGGKCRDVWFDSSREQVVKTLFWQ